MPLNIVNFAQDTSLFKANALLKTVPCEKEKTVLFKFLVLRAKQPTQRNNPTNKEQALVNRINTTKTPRAQTIDLAKRQLVGKKNQGKTVARAET
eukprot:347149-Amphidinium_carterae.1